MKKLIANSFIVVLAMSSLAYANTATTATKSKSANTISKSASTSNSKKPKAKAGSGSGSNAHAISNSNLSSSANSTEAGSSTVQAKAPETKESIVSGFLSTSRSTNLIDHQDGTRQDSMDYSARLNLRVNANFTVRAQTGYSQDLKDSENNDFANSAVSLVRKPFAIHDRLNMSYRIGTSLPTSKLAYKQQSLQSAATVGVSFLANPKYLIKGFDTSILLTATRNIHKYEEAYDGSINTKMFSTQVLSMSYTFANEIYLSANFTHINTWNYNNTMNDSFELSQEIGYTINPMFSFGVGHTNSGRTLKANGYESNVQIYDENSSMVYASGTLSF